MTVSGEQIVAALSIIIAAFVSITTIVLTRRTAHEANKVAEETTEIHSRAQVDASYVKIIETQRAEVDRLVTKVTGLETKITSLELVIVGLQKTVDTVAFKDREIERLQHKADTLTEELNHRQTLLDQLTTVNTPGPQGATGPQGPQGPVGIITIVGVKDESK
jgi:predicted RNase H-like nuclease (RuvC/YqgF family)